MHLPISDKIELNILHQNSHQAEKNKVKFNNYNLLCLNIMSSPGAGKTRLLEITLEGLSKKFHSAVLEFDMTTNLDAARLEKLNIPVVPITTGRACHLDANMVSGGLKILEQKINPDFLDILLVENVGNLVCPAEFEIGEHFKVALLSITEGEDKPLKYPIMFREADLILITKVDLLPHLNFDINELKLNISATNPKAEVIEISSVTRTGFDLWQKWISNEDFKNLSDEEINNFTYPLIAKSNKGGYDGKGNKKIKTKEDLDSFLTENNSDEWLIEEWIEYEKELALVGSRDRTGKIRFFPIVETFQSNHVCDWVLAPGTNEYDLNIFAINIFSSIVNELNFVGVLAIEFFYGDNGL